MIDPLGKILTEIRDFPAVAAITTRVRGEEAAQGDVRPLVVIRTFPIVREPRLPLARYQYLIQCYGTSPKQTAQLRGAVSDAIHHTGPRLSAAGIGIYDSFSETEGQAQIDPDTTWPFQMVTASVWASTMTVAS